MKKPGILFFVCLTMLLCQKAGLAQSINGSSSATVGSPSEYSFFDDTYMTSPGWDIQDANVSPWVSGSTYYANVTFTSEGTKIVAFYDGSTLKASMEVYVSPCTAPNPTGSFTYASSTTGAMITRTGSPPSGYSWFWQTAPTGTWTAFDGSTFTGSASNTYYLRARDNTYMCWSSGYLTTATIPSIPSLTNGSSCGSGTVTMTASAGSGGSSVRWYAGTSGGSVLATGTSYGPSISTTATYYACTYNSTTGAEGLRYAVTATVHTVPGNASSPAATPAAVYGTQTVTLSASGAEGGETYAWYSAGTGGSPISSSQTVSATTTYYVSRKITATGCESSTRSSVTVAAYNIPSITPATAQVIAYGGSVELAVSPSYYSYQWKLNGSVISGATAQSYVASESGFYEVVVQGGDGAPSYTASATRPLNQVSSTTLFKEGLDLNSVLDTLSRDELSQTISYMDGMGRPFQTIAVAASPDQYDMISAAGPEKQGLAITSYLPYVSTASNGLYRPYALRGANGTYAASEQYDFYQNASQVAHDAKPYSKTVYRQTPDARVIEAGAPGVNWQPDSAHTVRSQITFNAASDSVRKWNSVGVSNSYYDPNTVVVETTTDENDNEVKTFINALGQQVLKKVQYESTKWLKTYYIYDDYGRLKYQVPPRAVGLLDGSPNLAEDTQLDELIYRYDYDDRDRVIAKKIPGATDEEYIVYDKHDRVVLTQDGNLKAQGKWMFIKYDYYGRPAYSGLYTSADSRATLQTALNNENYNQSGVKWYECDTVSTYDYTNHAYPRSNITVLSVNYYDHYDFNRDNSADYSYDNAHLTTGQESSAQTSVRGSPTGSRRRTVDAAGNPTGTWLWSVVFYGAYDRVIQTLSNNHLYSTLSDKSSVIYNFSGQVVKSKTTHASSGSFSVSYVDRPVYDHAGRVLKQYRKINSDDEQLLAEYVYNKLGQVVDKKLHHTGSGNYLQSVDFRYNIRGWLTSINNAQLTNDGALNNDTGDYFGMELAYQQGVSGMGVSKQYNGNVSAVKWRTFGTTGAAGQRSFKYAYDNSDRLTEATFQASSGATTWDKEVNTLNETLTYDANGNIKSLVRKRNNRGLSGTTVTSSAQTIDELAYIYQAVNGGTQNSNKLVRVNEAVGGATGDVGFKNGASSDTEFTYNTWGSLKKDDNKKIDSIAYNFLGKPRKVYFNGGIVVAYTYDASGSKLSVKTDSSSTTKSFSNYVGGFVYEGTTPTLSFFSSPQGRVVKNESNYEYQYSISDHQGNTRVLFTSVTPEAYAPTATFEGGGGDSAGEFSNVSNVVSFTAANHTAGGIKVVRMNQAYAVGPAKSLKVYPGDSVKVEVWAYYEADEGYGTNGVALATAIAAAFGGSGGGTGEALKIFDGVNSALAGFGVGGSPDDEEPPAYLNYILFDQQYKVLDAGWQRVPTSANFARQEVTVPAKYITEAGYYFTYLSYEGESNNYVFFDDYKVRHVKSNLIQGNEYYPFGMQTANSWTRESVTGNNYLANGGTELNATSQLYDLMFRNYDPALGRMFQVDPMASKYGSITPYNYSLNNPSNINDPLGDDVEPQKPEGREYVCAMCWREGTDLINYMRVSGGGGYGFGFGGGGGGGGLGKYWHPGDGRMFWSGYESYARELRYDADAVRYGDLTLREYGSRHGTSTTTEQLRSMAEIHNNGTNPITGKMYSFNKPTVVGTITASGLLKRAITGNSPVGLWAGPGPKRRNAVREAEAEAMSVDNSSGTKKHSGLAAVGLHLGGTAGIGTIGINGQVGIVHDGRTKALFFSVAHAIGVDYSLNMNGFAVINRNDAERFTSLQLQGYGEMWSIGMGPFNYAYGGDGIAAPNNYEIHSLGLSASPLAGSLSVDRGWTWTIPVVPLFFGLLLW